MIRVELPAPLQTVSGAPAEVQVEVAAPVTQRRVLDAVEERYPMLRGTVRDRATGQRRAFIRFYVGREDLSHQSPDTLLPEAVAAGTAPLLIVGAMAGG